MGRERSFTTGDRIVFLRNDGTVGVRNGSFGVVEAIKSTEVWVRLDEDAEPEASDAASFVDFDRGCTTTVHGSQGATVDRSFVMAGPTVEQHLTFAVMARHRNAVPLYVDESAFEGRDGLVRRLSWRYRPICSPEMPRRGANRANSGLATSLVRI